MNWLVILLLCALGVAYLWHRHRYRHGDLSILPEQFVVVDLETTGLDPDKHEIIEIAAVKVNRDSKDHPYFQALIRPSKKVPKKITQLTGITQEALDKDGVELAAALAEFRAFIGELRLVAYNAPFDVAFLQRVAVQCGCVIANDACCALDMARRAWPGRKSYRLADLARDGRLTSAGPHRALHDCERTVIVYAAAAAKLRSSR